MQNNNKPHTDRFNLDKINVAYDSIIYKQCDLKIINSANEYLSNIEAQCNLKLEQTNSEVEKIKTDAYLSGLDMLHNENNELINHTSQKINSHIKTIGNNMLQIINNILNTIGYNNIQALQLKNIIDNELNKFNCRPQHITLKANQNTIFNLQELFIDHNIEYIVDNNLIDNDCIYQTDLFSLRISTTDYINLIQNNLN